VLAVEALTWAAIMLGLNALPPDPAVVGDGWRAAWLERLEGTPFYLEQWLAHQRRDEFWQQGSICEDYGALDCAVLAVGGWADGYTNAIPRMLAGLTAAGVPCRGLIGPWSHGWPQTASPGPRIGFLDECVRFWDRWLKDEQNGAMDGPLLRAYIQEPVPPAAAHPDRPGRFVAEPAWPPVGREPLVLYPSAGTLGSEPAAPATLDHPGVDAAGLDCGAWCPYGSEVDFPTDQRAEDALSLTFDGPPLAERLELLGDPVAVLALACDRPLGLVAVRLCDVAPDGSSLLLSRGLLNLTHRDGHDAVVPVRPGERIDVRMRLDAVGHAFVPGHRIRLALSPTSWPLAWPSPERVTLSVHTGPSTRLELPVRTPAAADEALEPFGPAVNARTEAVEADGSRARRMIRDVGTGRAVLELESSERLRFPGDGLTTSDRLAERFSIVEGDPLSARVEHSSTSTMERGDWRVRVETRSSLAATAGEFLVASAVEAFEGDAPVFARHRSVRIPRDGV
jgi:predicted acyl esterase